MRNQISRREYALLVAAVAQRFAGKGRTPSAGQHREAEKESKAAMSRRGVAVVGGTRRVDHLHERVRQQLSGVSGMGGGEVGSFWSRFKDAVSSTARTAQPVLPFVNPTVSLAVPITKAVLAQQAKRDRTRAEQETDESGSFIGEAWGQSISSTYDKAVASLSRGDDVGSFMNGDEALIFAEGGGSSELGAMRRRTPYYFPTFATGANGEPILTPDMYRAGVMQRALKLSGGRTPSTKNLFDAQTQVDLALQRSGSKVRIPGARPGRVTR